MSHWPPLVSSGKARRAAILAVCHGLDGLRVGELVVAVWVRSTSMRWATGWHLVGKGCKAGSRRRRMMQIALGRFQLLTEFQQMLKRRIEVKLTLKFHKMWYFQRMLKNHHLMKEAEAQAAQALRELLEKIPILEVEGIEAEALSGDWEPDLIARLLVDGRQHQLICEYKSNGQPRYARSALLELRNYIAQRAPEATPVFIAPYISPAVRQLCEEKSVGYLDLKGNARIAFGGVFIERVVADKPAAEQRELKSLFRPKSAQVLRAMLREPGRAWRVTELSEVSGVSLGHVSNVRTGLLDREWARASDDGLVLSEPDALLDAWRDSYIAPLGERLRFYTSLHGSALADAARSALSAEDGPGRAAFASFSAAQWLSPYGRTGTHYFFADTEGLRKLQAALKLEPASKGENVVVTVPKDVGLLADTVEPAPGAVCTSPVQTYLDLSIAGERGAEAADHLRQERLSWPN